MTRRNKAPPGMRVAMVFGGSVVAERTLDSPRDVVLGEASNAVMPLPHGAISAPHLTLLRESEDGGWELELHPSMGGAIWRDGKRQVVSQIDARRIRLGESDYGVLTVGAVAFFFQRASAGPVIGRRWLGLDPNAYAGLGLSTFLHFAALLLLFLAQREAPVTAMNELPADLIRRFLAVPAATVTPPEPVDDVRPEEPVEPSGGGDEGAPSPEVGNRARRTPRPALETRTSRAPNIGMLRAIQGEDGTGNALAAAYVGLDIAGLVDRTRVGGSRSGPDRGLGIRGVGTGGPGSRRRPGPGVGDTQVGDDEARDQVARRRRRAAVEHDIDIPRQPPRVDNNYPPRWIQRVVMRNRAQIRYCYESTLQRMPQLRGRVEVSWRIQPNGSVASVNIASSNLRDNGRVEGCITRQVRRWRFPPPESGRVGVSYPFLLGIGG